MPSKCRYPWSSIRGLSFLCSLHCREVCSSQEAAVCSVRVGWLWPPCSDLVASNLWRFCKLVHITRTPPPNLSSESLRAFDGETRSCFSACLAADVTDATWQQAQLSLSFGGLGLCSLALHSSSAFLASFSASGVGNTNNLQSLITFNSQVSHSDVVTIESVLADQPHQRSLSQKLDRHLFESLWCPPLQRIRLGYYQLRPPMPVRGSRLLPLLA